MIDIEKLRELAKQREAATERVRVTGYTDTEAQALDEWDDNITPATVLAMCDEIEGLYDAIKRARIELAALVTNPRKPDWMPALGNSNRGDADALQKAWAALSAAPSIAALREGG